jgi:hypothetical protein
LFSKAIEVLAKAANGELSQKTEDLSGTRFREPVFSF